MITVSAPGKLMIVGEHAVVYGHPCLVTAVDRRLTVGIEETDDDKLTINAPQASDTRFVEKALEVGCQTWKIRHHGLHLVTESSFSGKYGFGSSAAVVVATLAALATLFGQQLTKPELFDLAYRVILRVQGVGSGFDVAAAIFGGTLYFKRAKTMTVRSWMKRQNKREAHKAKVYFVTAGKEIEELNANSSSLPLVVGYTGIKSNSVELVKQVARKREFYREKVDRLFAAIAKLVKEGREALLRQDWERLGKLMDFDQEYLRDLGVSTQKLEDLISAAKKAGAYGAKLSGAGGGDCIIALATSDKQKVIREAIKDAGGEVIDVSTNVEGVRIEV